MLRGLMRSAVIGFVQRRTGITPAGFLPSALLTSGASLLLTRGRRPAGLAIAALGGLLLWREIERNDIAGSDEAKPAGGEATPPLARAASSAARRSH